MTKVAGFFGCLSFFFVTLTPALALDSSRVLNDEARILAGHEPLMSSMKSRLVNTQFNQFSVDSFNNWNNPDLAIFKSAKGVRHSALQRLDVARNWVETEMADFNKGCKTLLYAFGGADIINAQTFFPECQRYIMIGLEPVGAFPDIVGLTENKDVKRFNAILRGALQSQTELVQRGYIVTARTRGLLASSQFDSNVALIAYLLVWNVNTLVSSKPFCLGTDGREIWSGSAYNAPNCRPGQVSGVEINFLNSRNEARSVVYISTDLGDTSFNTSHPLWAYLNHTKARDGRPFVAMHKAASYLMYGGGFTHIRGYVLNNASQVLQDHSGIPYQFFANERWSGKFYGDLQQPLDPAFQGVNLNELRQVYYPAHAGGRKDPAIPDLTFSYGYNGWFGSLMKFERK